MQRLFVILLLGACSADGGSVTPDGAVCGGIGVGDAGAGTATVTIGEASFGYGGFHWGENNDCPAAGASVISVTIRGGQTQPTPAQAGIGVCLPRPDLIAGAPVDLGDQTRVQLAGASASGGGCTTTLASGARPTGTISFEGFCTRAGTAFAMTLAGQVLGTQTCGSGPAVPVTMVLGGRARVEMQP